MPSNEIQLEPTWLLHHTAYRDTSLIIDLFTLGYGRVSLMARSARSARPAVRALYQPFRPLLISWTGEGDLQTLIGIEEAGRPLDLDNRSLACAWYLNEIVLRLVGKGQAQPVLFAYYAAALAALAAGEHVEIVLRTFELQLLEGLGLLPDLARVTQGGEPIEPDRRYRFHPANAIAIPIDGAVRSAVHGAADAVPASGIGSPRGLLKPERRVDEGGDPGWHADGVTADEGIDVSGATLLAMARLDFSEPAVRDEARPLMKRLLREQLGDQPLKSRELFGALAGDAR